MFAKKLFVLLLGVTSLTAQQVVQKTTLAQGQIELTDGIAIPKINNGYTLWLPENGAVRGLILFTHPRSDTTQSDFLIDYALTQRLAVLYATTDNRLEFFFDAAKLQEIESYLHEVISTYAIPPDNLLYCGMSLEGTRALKLAIFARSGRSKYRIVPKAIAICDAPLDMVRFHKEMVKAVQRDVTPVTANEGRWVSGYLEKNLGGTPADTLPAYVNYSPYCYAADGGPNVAYLSGIALRCYTEPDVNWWITTRRKDYYAMNAVDLAALVNELLLRGNDNAALIVTHNKGYLDDGSRHPHTWNIVDEKALIDWFVALPQ